jgi:DNA repair exonuclease SbcCD ATPase subunit
MRIDFIEATCRNFLSYGNNITKFSLCKSPFVIITGDNGTGKSTGVVEIIHFALFGKLLRKSKKEQIVNNINKKNCEVSVRFMVNDRAEYLIERGLYPDYISITNVSAGTDPEDSRSAKKLMQYDIDRLLGFDQTTLKNICVLSINNSKSFVDLTAEETRNVVENIMGIQIFSSMLEKVKLKLKATKDMLEINKKDIDLYKGLVDDYNEKLRRSEVFKANFEKERKEKIEVLVATIIGLTKSIGIDKTDLELILPGDEIQRPETKKIGTIDTIKYDILINTYNAEYNHIALKDVSQPFKDLYQKKVEEWNRAISLCVSNTSELHNEISVLEEKNKANAKEIRKLTNKIDYFDVTVTCSECNSALDASHKQKETEKLNSEIDNLKLNTAANETLISVHNCKISGLNQDGSKLEGAKIKAKAVLDKKVSEIQAFKDSELHHITLQIDQVKKERSDYIEVEKIRSAEIQNENERLLSKFDEAVRERQKKLDAISYYQNRIDSSNKDVDFKNEQLKVLEADSIDKHIEDLLDVNKIKEYQVKYATLLKDKDVMNENMKYLSFKKEIFSDSGVKANIIKKDIPFLNQSINFYLKELGKEFGVEFNEEFEISLNSFNKRNLSYNSLSEGEKKRIDLAILLSFVSLTREKNSVTTNLLVFDEILDTSLDSEGRKMLINILKKKIDEGVIKNIFIISHNKNLQIDEAERVEVITEGGFSKIMEVAA